MGFMTQSVSFPGVENSSSTIGITMGRFIFPLTMTSTTLLSKENWAVPPGTPASVVRSQSMIVGPPPAIGSTLLNTGRVISLVTSPVETVNFKTVSASRSGTVTRKTWVFSSTIVVAKGPSVWVQVYCNSGPSYPVEATKVETAPSIPIESGCTSKEVIFSQAKLPLALWFSISPVVGSILFWCRCAPDQLPPERLSQSIESDTTLQPLHRFGSTICHPDRIDEKGDPPPAA